MNIGIDLDGVLFDTENLWRTIAVFYDEEINGKGIVDPEASLTQKRYNWSDANEKVFIDRYLLPGEKQASIMPYSKYVIDKLKNMGHKLYLISRRGYEDKGEIKLTEKLLRKAKIKFDYSYFSIADKLTCCKDLNINLMIDDNSSIVEELANNNINCLYYRNVYSRKINHPLVIEVNNWGDIYREIKK